MTRYVFYSWDKKRDIDKEIINRADVYLISERESVFVKWARYSQVEATLKLLKLALEWEDAKCFMLCSGKDLPIKLAKAILQFLEYGKGNSEALKIINCFMQYKNADVVEFI